MSVTNTTTNNVFSKIQIDKELTIQYSFIARKQCEIIGSTGIYSKHRIFSLDRQAEIENNLSLVRQAMQLEQLCLLKQVHGDNVVKVDKDTDFDVQSTADAMFTQYKHIGLAVQTADCVPVLLYSKQVIAAAHCGWRSTRSNVLRKVIGKMREEGAEQIMAVLGPSIQQDSYEVDQSLYYEFTKEDSAYSTYFNKSKDTANKYWFNLPGVVIEQLSSLGVAKIMVSAQDTYTDKLYPSYRRSTHTGETYFDSILSVISFA